MSLTGVSSRPAVTSTSRTLHGRSFPVWVSELAGHRKRLQDAWSDKTIHEAFRSPAGADVAASRGQCGVSSAWLVETLAFGSHHVRGLTYCYGDIFTVAGPELARHCWVEFWDGRDRLVIDVTGDQSKVLGLPEVLYDWHDELLTGRQIDYRPHTRLTPLQLKYDLVQPRLGILKENLRTKR